MNNSISTNSKNTQISLKTNSGGSYQNSKNLNISNVSDQPLGTIMREESSKSFSIEDISIDKINESITNYNLKTKKYEKVCKNEVLDGFDPNSLKEPIDTDHVNEVFLQCSILYNEFLSKIKKPELKPFVKESSESNKKTRINGRGILSKMQESKSREFLNGLTSRSTPTLISNLSENTSKKSQEIEIKKSLISLPTYPECSNEQQIDAEITEEETKSINNELSNKTNDEEKENVNEKSDDIKSVHEEEKPTEIKNMNLENQVVCCQQNEQEQKIETHLNESLQNLSIASPISIDSSLSTIECLLKENEQFKEKLLQLKRNMLDNKSVKSNCSSHASKKMSQTHHHHHHQVELNNNQPQQNPSDYWYLCGNPMCIENNSSHLRQSPPAFHLDHYRQNIQQLDNQHPYYGSNYDNQPFYRLLPNNQNQYDQNRNHY